MGGGFLPNRRGKKLWVDVGTRNHRMAEIHKVVPQFGIAKLVNITPIKPMVYGRYNELVFMGVRNQRSHHWGAPSCMINCHLNGSPIVGFSIAIYSHLLPQGEPQWPESQ